MFDNHGYIITMIKYIIACRIDVGSSNNVTFIICTLKECLVYI